MNRNTILLATALCAAAGCSAPRARVHGTVTYQGKALSEGTVFLIASDKTAYPAVIQADGGYEHRGIPCGRVEVSVQQEEPRPAPRPDPTRAKVSAEDDAKMSRRPAPVAKGVRIPTEFADANKSGIGFDLTCPERKYDIDLK